MKMPEVEYFASPDAVAYSTQEKVYVSTQLVAMMSPEEIAGIVMHELGHISLGHIPLKQLFDVLIWVAPGCWMLAFSTSVLTNLIVIAAFWLAWPLLRRSLNHHFEYEADAFTVRCGLGDPLARALSKITYDHSLASWGHPAIRDRIVRIYEKAGA